MFELFIKLYLIEIGFFFLFVLIELKISLFLLICELSFLKSKLLV